jgi:hypothetical protein
MMISKACRISVQDDERNRYFGPITRLIRQTSAIVIKATLQRTSCHGEDIG